MPVRRTNWVGRVLRSLRQHSQNESIMARPDDTQSPRRRYFTPARGSDTQSKSRSIQHRTKWTTRREPSRSSIVTSNRKPIQSLRRRGKQSPYLVRRSKLRVPSHSMFRTPAMAFLSLLGSSTLSSHLHISVLVEHGRMMIAHEDNTVKNVPVSPVQ